MSRLHPQRRIRTDRVCGVPLKRCTAEELSHTIDLPERDSSLPADGEPPPVWTLPRPPLLLAIVTACLLLMTGCTWTIVAPTPPSPPEPLVPTPEPSTAEPDATAIPIAPEIGSIAPGGFVTPPLPEPYTLRWRTGVGVPDGKSPLIYAWPQPRPGWYVNWSVGFTETARITETVVITGTLGAGPVFHIPPDEDSGMEFAPMVRMKDGKLQPSLEWLTAAARTRPGHTWLIGNEPDVLWQDNTTPEAYVRAYHDAYHAIKSADPTAQVAIGGLSQITPVRLAYLDDVWDHYTAIYGEEMPVDVWNMHAFVLQEKANDWGVDMPPGIEDVGEGMLWGIEDHDDLALVEGQIRCMREWMVDHGQKEKPLWITEYGILMPAEYGFDEERVRSFLLASNDLFANLRHPELGFAVDDDRLVQRWVWFSTGYDRYPTGDLFNREGQPTGLMHALSTYLAEFGE